MSRSISTDCNALGPALAYTPPQRSVLTGTTSCPLTWSCRARLGHGPAPIALGQLARLRRRPLQPGARMLTRPPHRPARLPPLPAARRSRTPRRQHRHHQHDATVRTCGPTQLTPARKPATRVRARIERHADAGEAAFAPPSKAPPSGSPPPTPAAAPPARLPLPDRGGALVAYLRVR
jgi:hypothetical protein